MHRPHTAYKGDIASYYWCDTVSTILLILAITIVSLVRIPYAIPFSCLPILVKRYRKGGCHLDSQPTLVKVHLSFTASLFCPHLPSTLHPLKHLPNLTRSGVFPH